MRIKINGYIDNTHVDINVDVDPPRQGEAEKTFAETLFDMLIGLIAYYRKLW